MGQETRSVNLTDGVVRVVSEDGSEVLDAADGVLALATGDCPTFDAPAFFATGYDWLDAATLVMIAQRSQAAPFELLTCQVPAGTCRSVAELGTYDQMAERGVVLPVGLPQDL